MLLLRAEPYSWRDKFPYFEASTQSAADTKAPVHIPERYGLRHFFISYCVMSGIPSLTIARWVGHNSSKMIEQVYGHLTPDYYAEQMMKFNIYKDREQKANPQANANTAQAELGNRG
jgi:integrase